MTTTQSNISEENKTKLNNNYIIEIEVSPSQNFKVHANSQYFFYNIWRIFFYFGL